MQWRVVPGWDAYEVSSRGHVRRCLAGNSHTGVAGHVLKPKALGRYLGVLLSQDGRTATAKIHRLVLITFVGSPPTPKHEGAHWDGNPHNNNLTNLRWATRAENQADKVRLRTVPRKFSDDAIRAVRARVAAGETQRALAAEYGMSKQTVCLIVHRKVWRHL